VSADLLRQTSRWVFFVALALAPWFYGGTTAQSIVVINWLLGAALLLWLAELLVNRRLPVFPRPLIVIVMCLLLIGIWMTINAHSIYDVEFGVFSPIASFVPRGWGSLDYAMSAAWMIRGALLLVSILFVADLSRSDRFFLQLWQVVGLVAGSISLLGLLQKATGAGAIFWQTPMADYAKTFFATYYYHANAGAYLNLVLPLTAGLAVRAFGTPSNQVTRSLWLLVFLLNLGAIASNTSRGSQLVAGIILVGILWQLVPRVFRGLSKGEKNVALAGFAAILLTLYAIGQASHLEQPISHWSKSGAVAGDARWAAAQVALHALPGVGFLGLGPGTFRAVFPSLNAATDNLAGGGTWRFLHEDYLQTVIEWGWLGSAFWALLFFGGIAAATSSLRKQNALRRNQKSEVSSSQGANFTAGGREHFANRPREAGDLVLAKTERSGVKGQIREWSRRRRLMLPMAVIALLGVALHALVDFPLQIESIQLYAATYLGLCWGAARWRSAPSGR
jgi:hypothetical protein